MPTGRPDIARAARRLLAGGLVAFPTETVYGLGACARNPRAVRAVFRAKGRPARNPLIVHVPDARAAREAAAIWPEAAARLTEALWPGPLTIVLPKRRGIADEATAGGRTVALRCPDHPLALDLLRAVGEPLVGPSANRSGGVSPTTAAHVRAAFPAGEVLVLDGGPCPGGIESSVLDLTTDPPRLLRPGLLCPAHIERVLGAPIKVGSPAPSGPARSPGLLRSHYAPAAPAMLLDPEQVPHALAGLPPDRFAVVLAPGLVKAPEPHRQIAMPADPEAYAARLYAALREADASGPAALIVVRPWPKPAPEGLWLAIADRLARATAPRNDNTADA
jgi:L-threonylcarbamoyladenylate synthase